MQTWDDVFVSYLQNLLILLCLGLVDLLHRLDVLLYVNHSVLPRLKSFGKQPSSLANEPHWLGHNAGMASN